MKFRTSELSGGFRAPRIRNTDFRLVSMQKKVSVLHSTAEELRTQGQQEPRMRSCFISLEKFKNQEYFFCFRRQHNFGERRALFT